MKTTNTAKYIRISLLGISLLLTPHLSHAQAGDRGGNGGTGMIAEFEFNVEQIKNWMDRGNLKKIHLKNVDVTKLETALKSAAMRILNHSISINFTDKDLKISSAGKLSAPRTCKNYPEKNAVLCNIKRWSKETPYSRYTLVMHELLGLASFEKNDGLASEYRISRQLMPYVIPNTNYILSDSTSSSGMTADLQVCSGMVGVTQKGTNQQLFIFKFPSGKLYSVENTFSESAGPENSFRFLRQTGTYFPADPLEYQIYPASDFVAFGKDTVLYYPKSGMDQVYLNGSPGDLGSVPLPCQSMPNGSGADLKELEKGIEALVNMGNLDPDKISEAHFARAHAQTRPSNISEAYWTAAYFF